MKKIKIAGLILSVCWMILIFTFSNQTAVKSDTISRNIVTNFIIEHYDRYDFLKEDEQIRLADVLDFVVRKAAHFTEYAVLGILYSITLTGYGVHKKYGKKRLLLVSAVMCCIYAASDELHQIFVPGRNGNIRDVCIDTMGGITGAVIVILCIKIIRSRKNFLSSEGDSFVGKK